MPKWVALWEQYEGMLWTNERWPLCYLKLFELTIYLFSFVMFPWALFGERVILFHVNNAAIIIIAEWGLFTLKKKKKKKEEEEEEGKKIKALPSGLVVRDSALSPLWLGFNPWPGNFCMPWAWPKEKKRRKRKLRVIIKLRIYVLIIALLLGKYLSCWIY